MASDSNTGEPERRLLVQQNIDLRRKLEEEHQNYKRKLSNYQEGQQKQAELVQKLQQKVIESLRSCALRFDVRAFLQVLQYKKRCSELELLFEQQKHDIEHVRLTVRRSELCSKSILFASLVECRKSFY